MTTEFTHAATLAAREPDKLRDPRVAQLLTTSAGLNRPILSGAAGRQVIQEYSELLQDFGNAGWSRLALVLSRAEKFHGGFNHVVFVGSGVEALCALLRATEVPAACSVRPCGGPSVVERGCGRHS